MPTPCQIEYQNGIYYFNVSVMFVRAENPIAAGDIPAPFRYDIWAYELKDPPSDPPNLGEMLAPPVIGRINGQGGLFRIKCGLYNWIVFASQQKIFEGDPWDATTRTCMQGTADVQPESWYDGYLKFHLLP